MASILLVDDDEDIAGRVKTWLEHDRHAVDCAGDGQTALAFLKVKQYDLLILDWTLPDLSGVDVCRNFRKAGGKSPVLMLTARTASTEKITGLDAGADDYITKPFDLDELSARVRALIRRNWEKEAGDLVAGKLAINRTTQEVKFAGVSINLFPMEFDLLELLMRYPDKWFSPDALKLRLRDGVEKISTENIRTYIKTLRKKLAACGGEDVIESGYGLGYRLIVNANDRAKKP